MGIDEAHVLLLTHDRRIAGSVRDRLRGRGHHVWVTSGFGAGGVASGGVEAAGFEGGGFGRPGTTGDASAGDGTTGGRSADDGPAGNGAATAAALDAVVIDLRVSPAAGWALLRRLRRTGDTAVVVITPADRERDVVRATVEGADCCLPEPCSSGDVIAAVDALLATPPGERRSARSARLRTGLRRLAELDSGRVADGSVRLSGLEHAPDPTG